LEDINPKVKGTGNAIYITLLMSSLNNVKLTDITIEKGQLIIKRLVRDKLREQLTIALLQQLFEKDLTIINQLELVIINDTTIEKIEVDLVPLPKLEKPSSFSDSRSSDVEH